MMNLRFVLLTFVCLCLAAGGAAAPAIGDPAPNFELTGTDGKEYSLAQFKGKRAVILSWYPRALTPGCRTQCKSIDSALSRLSQYEVEVFGVSVDRIEDNRRFVAAENLRFVLLSDPNRELATKLGVLNPESKAAYRWCFLIDADGKILHVIKGLTPATHGAQLVELLDKHAIPKRPGSESR